MPTTIKAALKKWEEATGNKASEAKEIKINAMYPPIEKLDASMSQMAKVEKLSLSTNYITTIANLGQLKHLKVLSLGRNVIKHLQGIEGASDTLQVLWISYNQIDRLKPLRSMQKLKVLFMTHNFVRDWREFDHLSEIPKLEDLCFVGNPLEEAQQATGRWKDEVSKRLLALKKLDGYPVIRDDIEDDEEEVQSTLDADEIENMAKYFILGLYFSTYCKIMLCSKLNFSYINSNSHLIFQRVR